MTFMNALGPKRRLPEKCDECGKPFAGEIVESFLVPDKFFCSTSCAEKYESRVVDTDLPGAS